MKTSRNLLISLPLLALLGCGDSGQRAEEEAKAKERASGAIILDKPLNPMAKKGQGTRPAAPSSNEAPK